MRLMQCRFARCQEFGTPVPLPFSDRMVILCSRHRGWALLVRMLEIVA